MSRGDGGWKSREPLSPRGKELPVSRAGLEVVDDSMHAFPSSPAVIAHDVCGKIRCYNIMQITIIYLCMVGLRSGCLCALCINFSCAVTCLAADQECILVDYYYFVVVSYIYTKYSTVSLFLVAGMNEAMGIRCSSFVRSTCFL